MPWQLSAVVRVPGRCPGNCQEWCRYPGNCQEWCRYPAGALATVRSGAEIGLQILSLSVSQGVSLGDFLLAPVCPIEKITLWEGFLYLTLGSETTLLFISMKYMLHSEPPPSTSRHAALRLLNSKIPMDHKTYWGMG